MIYLVNNLFYFILFLYSYYSVKKYFSIKLVLEKYPNIVVSYIFNPDCFCLRI
jgi:hypothetical protein